MHSCNIQCAAIVEVKCPLRPVILLLCANIHEVLGLMLSKYDEGSLLHTASSVLLLCQSLFIYCRNQKLVNLLLCKWMHSDTVLITALGQPTSQSKWLLLHDFWRKQTCGFRWFSYVGVYCSNCCTCLKEIDGLCVSLHYACMMPKEILTVGEVCWNHMHIPFFMCVCVCVSRKWSLSVSLWHCLCVWVCVFVCMCVWVSHSLCLTLALPTQTDPS